MSQASPSVREKIISRRNAALRYAAVDVAGIAVSVTLAVTFGVPWLLMLTGILTLGLALNSAMTIRAQQALNTYKRNPAAAYLAEIRNTFE